MGNLSFGEILLIALVALVIFGPSKLPEIGRTVGRTIMEFKRAGRELLSMDEPAAPASRPNERSAAPAESSATAAPQQMNATSASAQGPATASAASAAPTSSPNGQASSEAAAAAPDTRIPHPLGPHNSSSGAQEEASGSSATPHRPDAAVKKESRPADPRRLPD